MKISLFVYAATVVALAVSTFLSPTVYGSSWFIALWGAFAVVLVAIIGISRMWRNAGSFILHVSFLAILGGGLLTFLTRQKGSVRIEPGQEVTTFTAADGKSFPLPVAVRLEKFEVDYYPGGVVPRDYISHLLVNGERKAVSMNKILDINGYRLLQASYDSSGATVLTVNHDPYGMPLSYAGYALFTIGGVVILLTPGGRFRRIIRELAAAVFLIFAGSGQLDAASIEGVPRASADSLRTRQVLYEGRVVCLNTLARDVVTKLYGKPSFRGLSPEQTLLSLRLFPDTWKNQPILKIKDKEVRNVLGIKGSHASISQLFDSLGNYRVEGLYTSLGERKIRAVEELDEKVGIVLSLYSDRLIVTPPAGTPLLSDERVQAEIFYNSVPFSTIIFILLFCGFFAGMSQFLSFRKGMCAARLLLWGAFSMSAACFALQWYLSGRIPLANTFETLQFVALIMEILLLAAARHNSLVLPLGMLVAGAASLVAHLVEMNPVVTPLMPVLHSGWLSLHVSLVMTAYAILCFTFINAIAAMIRKSNMRTLMSLSIAMLYPGVILLGMGIFTGAVWANVSWGQYWSWDPKETWALVTMLIYALPLHRKVPLFRNPRLFHIYLLAALLSIAMTYFGVNHLDSMHAYN